MAENRQDSAAGALQYRVMRSGEIRRVEAPERRTLDDEAVEKGETYVVARLEHGRLDVRIGATAKIGGERLVNREYEVNDTDLTAAVKDALKAVLDDVRHLPERQVLRDAEDDIRLDAQNVDDDDDDDDDDDEEEDR